MQKATLNLDSENNAIDNFFGYTIILPGVGGLTTRWHDAETQNVILDVSYFGHEDVDEFVYEDIQRILGYMTPAVRASAKVMLKTTIVTLQETDLN